MHRLYEVWLRLVDWWWLKAAVGGLVALLEFLFGPWNSLYGAIVAILTLDLVTGVMAALREGRLSSEVAKRRTVDKFIGYFTILALANLAQHAGFSEALGVVQRYVFAAEALSVIENCERLLQRNLGLSYLKDLLERIFKNENNQAGRGRS